MEKFYFCFHNCILESIPCKNGYIVVHAEDFTQALTIFAAIHPFKDFSDLDFGYIYRDEEAKLKHIPEKGFEGYGLYEVLNLQGNGNILVQKTYSGEIPTTRPLNITFHYFNENTKQDLIDIER